VVEAGEHGELRWLTAGRPYVLVDATDDGQPLGIGTQAFDTDLVSATVYAR
jgi:hypothetical protein